MTPLEAICAVVAIALLCGGVGYFAVLADEAAFFSETMISGGTALPPFPVEPAGGADPGFARAQDRVRSIPFAQMRIVESGGGVHGGIDSLAGAVPSAGKGGEISPALAAAAEPIEIRA